MSHNVLAVSPNIGLTLEPAGFVVYLKPPTGKIYSHLFCIDIAIKNVFYHCNNAFVSQGDV